MTAVAELERDSDSSPATSSGVSAALNGSDAPDANNSSGASLRAPSGPMPSEEQLLDVLYEVLAQGVPPRSKLKREEVERFLHQHARERKPIEEMLLFFERHGLPTDAGEYGADQQLRELASGLQKERGSLILGFGPASEPVQPEMVAQQTPVPASSSVATAAAAAAVAAAVAAGPSVEAVLSPPAATSKLVIEGEPTGRRTVVRSSTSSRAIRWLGLCAALIALGLLGASFLSSQRADQLEQRLDQARMQQRSTDLALTKLEQHAQTLQGALEKSEEERRAEAARLESTLAAEKQQRVTEELTVERMLGPRYLKLRQKLSNEGSQPTATTVAPAKPTATTVAPAKPAVTTVAPAKPAATTIAPKPAAQ